jgi:hypothetical protein
VKIKPVDRYHWVLTRRAILAALAGAALDPERLLYRPGAKLISIPAPQEFAPFGGVVTAVSWDMFDLQDASLARVLMQYVGP